MSNRGVKRNWTDEEVRTIFLLRSQGKTLTEIGEIMQTSAWSIGEIIHRRMGAHVYIDPAVLEVVSTGKRGKRRPAIKPPDNGAMPQALKAADPAYMKPRTPDTREPVEIPGLTPAVPPATITRAQALQEILKLVELSNNARLRVVEAKKLVREIEADAAEMEDKAFKRMQSCRAMGMSGAFIDSLLTESGLCSEGAIFSPADPPPKASPHVGTSDQPAETVG